MAESTLMMSKGNRAISFNARSVLPFGVGQIKKTTGVALPDEVTPKLPAS
jgi:hypothetical protein